MPGDEGHRRVGYELPRGLDQELTGQV
jgi:hypothetical protein